MPTQQEELQVKEFLKRAEIKTMKKDLRALREADALKERNRIVKVKTLEEQEAEAQKKLEQKESARQSEDKFKREQVLERGAEEERMAEKDLKEYATEQERQQIFQLEAKRLDFKKQTDAIDKDKSPSLKLQKNEILIQIKDLELKLKSVLDQKKKLEGEQNFVAQKAHQSNITAEKKGFEQRRWDIDKDIQNLEKKEWEADNQIENLKKRIQQIDRTLQQLVEERNALNQKILGIDKQLREIYSAIIARVEEKRRGEEQEQKYSKEALSKARTEEKEKIQRQQWAGKGLAENKNFFKEIPVPVKESILKSATSEDEQRKKFIQDVETWAEGSGKNTMQRQQVPGVPPAPKK